MGDFFPGAGSNYGSFPGILESWFIISPFQNTKLNNEFGNKDIKFTIAYHYFPLNVLFYLEYNYYFITTFNI